jgi:hypothetical protein
MAGIRQTAAFEYASSDKVQTEFENVIRYLQQAEVGSKTLGEIIEGLTDDNGNLNADISFRVDSAAGLQFKAGETGDWTTIAPLSDIRGEAGQNVGDIGAPIFNGRQDYVIGTTIDPTTSVAYPDNTTTLQYAHTADDTLVVFRNGLLQRDPEDYSTNATTGTVTFVDPLTVAGNTGGTAETVTVYKIRATAITSFQRVDYVVAGQEFTFAFTMDDTTEIQVYFNGVLLREGGSNDYIRDNNFDTVTLNLDPNTGNSPTTTGDVISIITVENTANQVVAGLMLEQAFTNQQTGKILFDKLELADGAIAQAKVANLTTDLAGKAGLSDTTAGGTLLSAGPVNTFYLEDVSGSPRLRFKVSETQNVDINPAIDIPSPSSANSGKFIRVSAAGAYELSALTDVLSGYITIAQKDAANGVPSLDSNLLINIDRIPSFSVLQKYPLLIMDEAISNPAASTSYRIKRISGARVRLKQIWAYVDQGTLDLDILVGGVSMNQSIPVTSTEAVTPLTDIIIDARQGGPIELKVDVGPTVNGGPTSLEVVIEADYVE